MLYSQTHKKWPEEAITRSYLEYFKVFVTLTCSVPFTLEVDKLQIFC